MVWADFACSDCGEIRTLDLPRDEDVYIRCCIPEPDRDVCEHSIYRRVWSPVSIGPVMGAGGSPGRYGRQ